MSPSGLSGLPAEIIVEVMTHLETPRDLFALIRASRLMVQVLQGQRNGILVAVISNAMPNGNLHHGIAACEAASVFNVNLSHITFADHYEERQAYRDVRARNLKAFFEDYLHGHSYENRLAHDSSLLQSLYRLWWISSFFTSRFEKAALAIATDSISLARTQRIEARTITSGERQKVQRAFFRFEIFRRITRMCGGGVTPVCNNSRGVLREQFSGILQRFPPWVREEILTVEEFLTRYVKDVCRDLENFLVDEISTLALTVSRKAEAHTFCWEEDPTQIITTILERNDINVFSRLRFVYPETFACLVGLGLPFLHWFANLSPQQRICAFMHQTVFKCTLRNIDVLHRESDAFHANDQAMRGLYDSYTYQSEEPNEGWLWAQSSGLTMGQQDVLRRFNLRKTGYAFWDAARLVHDWKLYSIRPEMLDLTLYADRKANREWTESLEKPSIQDQLKNIRLPKGAWDPERCWDSESNWDPDATPFRFLQPDIEWKTRVETCFPCPLSEEEDKFFNIEY